MYSFRHFIVLIACMYHNEVFLHFVICMFTGTALCKCLLITKPAYVITRCFFTSLFKNAFYSQKPHGLESFFLHMFSHFVFIHLRIRNCLLSTKTALARIRFSSDVWLLCVKTFPLLSVTLASSPVAVCGTCYIGKFEVVFPFLLGFGNFPNV